MDERAVNGAAIEAISDLQLDCEIKEVSQSASGDDWCIQFSGKYGRFCDGFQNQFGKESSHEVIREKIKGYLIKQVNKIRVTTGRKRKAMVADLPEKREPESDILSAPLKLMGELFDRVAGIAGGVVSQVAPVMETARDAVADVAANITPVIIEVRSTTPEVKKRASRPSSKKAVKKTKVVAAKATKATKRVARKAGKGEKKAVKSVKKAAKKSSRKRKE